MNWSTSRQYLSSVNILLFMAVIDLQHHILPSILRDLAVASSEISQPVLLETAETAIHDNEFNATLRVSQPTFISTSVHKDSRGRKLTLLSSQLSTMSSSKVSLLPSKWLSTTMPSFTFVPLSHSTTMAPSPLSMQNKNLPLEMRKTEFSYTSAHYVTMQPFNSVVISTSTANTSPLVNSIQNITKQTIRTMSDSTASSFQRTTNFNKKFDPESMVSNTSWTNLDLIGNMTVSAAPYTFRVVTKKSRMFRNNNNKHHHEHHWGPFFEQPLNSTTSGDNITAIAHLFTEAILNCRVGMLKDKTVMWVKRTADKVSLLTVGNVTYSSDPRLQVKFQYPNNWRLLINPTQWSDTGIYMCQVSTHPPRVFTTNLTIIEPPLRLIDEQERDFGDRYYKTGSTIDLQCQVSRNFLQKQIQNILQSLMPLNMNKINFPSSYETPTSQYLYEVSYGMKILTKEPEHDNSFKIKSDYNKILPHTNPKVQPRNAIEKQFNSIIVWSKDDEQLPSTAYKRFSMEDKWLTSRISIRDAQISDSGNYSCSIGRLFTAIVQVQVLTGESPAAVQHNSGHWIKSRSTKHQQFLRIYIMIILHIFQFNSYN